MNKTVLITGAANGIGRETALRFAREDYRLILTCHSDADALDALREEIASDVLTYVYDIADGEKVREMFAKLAVKDWLPDIIINNAGISYVGLLQDMDMADWNRILATNLTGVFNTCRHGISHMVTNRSGKIINISSMWGNVGASCEVAYSATKGGINAFTKALAKELAPSNIQVNAIAFGTVDTRMNAFLDEEEKAALIAEIPAGRMCSVTEAASIIYKVSMLDEYVTGQIITADGGLT